MMQKGVQRRLDDHPNSLAESLYGDMGRRRERIQVRSTMAVFSLPSSDGRYDVGPNDGKICLRL